MGIGTMSRGEKAVIYVTSQYLSESPLLPSVEGIEEAHFEVELIHFIQVWKCYYKCFKLYISSSLNQRQVFHFFFL